MVSLFISVAEMKSDTIFYRDPPFSPQRGEGAATEDVGDGCVR